MNYIALLGLIIGAGVGLIIFKVYRRLRSDEATDVICTRREIVRRLHDVADEMQEIALQVDCYKMLRAAAPESAVQLQSYATAANSWADKIECAK